MSPELSVVMPVKTLDKYFIKSVSSLINQKFDRKELIVISDLNMSAEISKLFNSSWIKIIETRVKDSGGRRNIGIKNARGNYIVFLDADDELYSSDSLDILYSAITKSGCNIAGGSCVIRDEKKERVYYRKDLINLNLFSIVSFNEFQYETGFYRFIFKKEQIMQNGMFHRILRFQDSLFLVENLIKEKKICLISDIVYLYRKGHIEKTWNFKMYRSHISGVLRLLEIGLKKDYKKLIKRMLINLSNNKRLRIELMEKNEILKAKKYNHKVLLHLLRNIKIFTISPYAYLKAVLGLI